MGCVVGGPLPALQAGVMLSLFATMLAWGPSPQRSVSCWSPERAWWHCHVTNADFRLPDNKELYALRDRLALSAASRGEYDSSTVAFVNALHWQDPYLAW